MKTFSDKVYDLLRKVPKGRAGIWGQGLINDYRVTTMIDICNSTQSVRCRSGLKTMPI